MVRNKFPSYQNYSDGTWALFQIEHFTWLVSFGDVLLMDRK